MAKINLVRGFTLRKRLRTILDKITLALSTAQTYIEVSTTYPDGNVVNSSEKAFSYKDKSLLETYKVLEKGSSYITELNNLIDDANNINARKIINELEAEKSKISMLKRLASNSSRFTETISTYDTNYMTEGNKSCGGIITRNYKLVEDFDWTKEADDCRKKIVILEDKLSEVNSTTYFEVPEEIINFIEENI